jgi:hypothetical protein
MKVCVCVCVNMLARRSVVCKTTTYPILWHCPRPFGFFTFSFPVEGVRRFRMAFVCTISGATTTLPTLSRGTLP